VLSERFAANQPSTRRVTGSASGAPATSAGPGARLLPMAGYCPKIRLVVTRPAAYGAHRGLLLDELIAGASLCLLLVCWSALRAWQLSPGRQARHALANGVWPRGTYEYKLRHDGVAWRAPDGSATFLPWPALAGACETGRLFLLLDLEGRNVRGFIPKTGRGDLEPDAEFSSLIRERINSGIT